MTIIKNKRWLILIIFVLTACASNEIYRKEFQSCVVASEQSCQENSLQVYNEGGSDEFLLGFVEIDDQGQLRNRAQLNALIDTLYQMAADGNSLLINVFVHGWHHSAQPGDSNIDSFRSNLAALSVKEHNNASRPRKVVGVYIGWRGDSITVPGINTVTFWDRKSTAQEVGYLGVTEILLRLEEIKNVGNASSGQGFLNSRLVILGHSFGAAVVYSAISQILASRFVDSRIGKNFNDSAKGLGDLVVLLNPAFEALRYAPFFDLSQSRCSYFQDQKPKLVILTSEADSATGYAFPMGRFFSTLFETHDTITRNDCQRPVNYHEGEADRHAVGHFEPLISHTLMPAEEQGAQRIAESDIMTSIWSKQEQGGSTRYGSTVLTHLGKTHPLNPYLNVRVDPELIADHNDVFGNRVMEFIRLLIVLSTYE